MLHVLVNYNFTPDKEFIGEDYLIYDRSDYYHYLQDFDQTKIKYTKNLGQVDYDKLSYLIDNYNNLPDVFLWGKTNLFKYITEGEYGQMKDNQTFTPLLTANHKTYSDENGVVNKYDKGIYWERADSWYFGSFVQRYVTCWEDWCDIFNLPKTAYVPFAPGGNYLLTKEAVHKYSKHFYIKMRNMLNYTREPVEAQCAERSYYLLWA